MKEKGRKVQTLVQVQMFFLELCFHVPERLKLLTLVFLWFPLYANEVQADQSNCEFNINSCNGIQYAWKSSVIIIVYRSF
jgi:hypothetical protein